MTSEHRAELVGRHADDSQDVPQGALGYVPTRVDRHRDCAPVGMLHHVVAAIDPCHGESGAFQRLDYLCSRYDWDVTRHTRTLSESSVALLRIGGDSRVPRWGAHGNRATLSVRVSSSGGPTTSSRASSAARRSAIAASCVGPSPTAPTPGRSWAEAHQTPSSSCSTT
jgi:hypothetical protein